MEELDYDIVVYGTGLVNCLITSILLKKLNKSGELKDSEDDAEKGKGVKILNIDKHNEYGNNYRTLNLKQFLSLNNVKSLKQNSDDNSTTDNNSTSNENTDDNNDNLDNNDDLKDNEEEEGLENNEKEDKDELKTIFYELNPFGKEGDENEIKELINNKNNEFNIDLWPKLILNNSHFVDYLVFTNLYKQIQFTTNFNNNIYFFNPSLNSSSTSSPSKDNNANNSNTNKEDNNNKKEDNSNKKEKEDKKEKENKKEDKQKGLLEVIYDKNSIFRSSYLTIREKRILTKFLHSFVTSNANNTSNTDKDNTNSSNKEDNKDNNKEQREDWVEYLKRNNLNEKLLDLVNLGMCFNGNESLEFEMNRIRLDNYLKSFDVNKKNKNCFIYSLYGLNNIIQYICRLCSLYNCHYMLNNMVNSLIPNFDDSTNNNSNNPNDDNNNMDSSNNNNNNSNKEDNKRKFVLELKGYRIHTNYVISEYDIPFLCFDNSFTSSSNYDNLTDNNNNKDNNKDNEDNKEKTLVTCFISNKKLFNSFNLCIATNYFTDNSTTTTSTDHSTTNRDNKNNKNNSTTTTNDNKGYKDNEIYVIQTCKDNLTSPEGVYVLYFMTKTREDYSEEIDLRELVEGKGEHKDLLRVLKLFESLSGDLSSILFVSYSCFDSVNKVQFVAPDARPGSFQVHDNFYSLDNLCIFNELYVSQHLSHLFLEIYNSTGSSHGGDGGSKDNGNLTSDNNDNNNNNNNNSNNSNKDDEQGLNGYKGGEKRVVNRIKVNEEMVKGLNLEEHLRYREEEETEWEINCDFLNEFISKFF